ncbi:MAG TPA: TetR/AcrR family transcriptional regulator [Burkholderiaceae bacterium]|nr:TetR/AcrR family transcriptional regulator [Burkholderiaceae bacterium]
MSDLAAAAGVSRATAYRYFPSRGTLISAVIDESLRPVRHWTSSAVDGAQRIDELFENTLPRLQEYEAQMRAALQLALEHWSAARTRSLGKPPFTRGFRRAILERNAAPLRARLGPKAFDRLLKALSLVYGIESFVVLKDIWGVREPEIEAIVRWVAAALVSASIAQTSGRQPRVSR